MSVRQIIKMYLLLTSLRSKRRGFSVCTSKRRWVKKLIAFNLLKREQQRMAKLAKLAFRKRTRKWHVRPIFRDRKTYGAWYNLIPVMRELDLEEHFNFFRMTPECFDYLLDKVGPVIEKKSYRQSISPGERLAVTLRYLASGDSQKSLSYLFRIANQTISDIIFETTVAIWFALKDEVFEPLSETFWMRKAAEFECLWQFPMCIGAIDGKHCFVQKFPTRGSEHHNYKGTHSVVLFAVSDAKYKFIVVDVGAKGRESDGGVFARSDFGKLFEKHSLRIPPPVCNGYLQDYLPYVFVGDDAFPLHEHLMKPFSEGMSCKPEETIYNYRLSRARRVVENAFGILSARFRILRRTMIVSETLAQNIILATVALHNLHLMREDSIPPKQRTYLPPGFADFYKSNGVLKKGRWRKECKDMTMSIFSRLNADQFFDGDIMYEKAAVVREKFVELFVTQPVSWQWDLLPTI